MPPRTVGFAPEATEANIDSPSEHRVVPAHLDDLESPFLDDVEQRAKRRGGVFRDKHGRLRTWADQRTRTVVVVNLAGILERCNEQTLPSLYRYVGRSFAASPQELGYITLACALTQAVCAPLGGILGHRYDRVRVMSAGAFVWGVMAILFSFTRTVTQGLCVWAWNGLGLGLLVPNAQSLVADYFSDLSRGKAFGALYLTGALGATVGTLFAANMGRYTFLGILDGWRAAFLGVGLCSLAIGFGNLAWSVDPRVTLEDPEYEQPRDVEAEHGRKRAVWADVKKVIAVPSFLIIVAQGIVGSTPWNALVFTTLYFQLLGMSDFHASLITSLFLTGSAIGGQLGGWIGDRAAARHPRHGRVLVAQFSAFVGVPISFLVFKVLPVGSSPAIVAIYSVSFFFWGSLISWVAPACNSPVFAEVVPAQLRAIVYSFDRAFEGAVAACGAPIVGWLAARLGFRGSASGGVDLEQAAALGSAICICSAVPWTLCGLLFSGLHYTYPRDRKRARVMQRTRSGVEPREAEAEAEEEEREEELKASGSYDASPGGREAPRGVAAGQGPSSPELARAGPTGSSRDALAGILPSRSSVEAD